MLIRKFTVTNIYVTLHYLVHTPKCIYKHYRARVSVSRRVSLLRIHHVNPWFHGADEVLGRLQGRATSCWRPQVRSYGRRRALSVSEKQNWLCFQLLIGIFPNYQCRAGFFIFTATGSFCQIF